MKRELCTILCVTADDHPRKGVTESSSQVHLLMLSTRTPKPYLLMVQKMGWRGGAGTSRWEKGGAKLDNGTNCHWQQAVAEKKRSKTPSRRASLPTGMAQLYFGRMWCMIHWCWWIFCSMRNRKKINKLCIYVCLLIKQRIIRSPVIKKKKNWRHTLCLTIVKTNSIASFCPFQTYLGKKKKITKDVTVDRNYSVRTSCRMFY